VWNPIEHSDDENARWCFLRAIEWGRWPLFLSQSIAPLLLLFLPWLVVVAGFCAANILWSVLARYRFVSIHAAFVGVMISILRWLTWPCATIILFIQGRSPECWIAALWPALILAMGLLTHAQTVRIQCRFMEALGYEPSEVKAALGIGESETYP